MREPLYGDEYAAPETILFREQVVCGPGDTITMQRGPDGRVCKVTLVRATGQVEDVPFDSAPGAARPA